MLYCPAPSGKCEIDILICNNGKRYGRTCCISCKGPKYYDQIPEELLKPKDPLKVLFDAVSYRKTEGLCQKTGTIITRDWCVRKFKMANIKRNKGDEKKKIGPECTNCNRRDNWIIINKESN